MLWIVIVLVCLVLAMLIFLFPVIQVCGDSMFPTFNDGDIIIGCRLFSLTPKNIYIYRPPIGQKYVIKRLNRVSPVTGNLFFEGDNKDCSYDSRMYGYVNREQVVAKYIFTIYRKENDENGCK